MRYLLVAGVLALAPQAHAAQAKGDGDTLKMAVARDCVEWSFAEHSRYV